jgi:hypothetical protein
MGVLEKGGSVRSASTQGSPENWRDGSQVTGFAAREQTIGLQEVNSAIVQMT